MMPDNVLSTPNVPGAFQPPEDRPVGQYPIVAYELGGIALNDSSQGLQYQVWVFEIMNFVPQIGGDGVSVRPEVGGASTVFYSGSGITEISGAFDANMNPTLIFVENGLSKLRWYDSSISNYALTDLPGALSPRLTLDDKREAAGSSRDILLFYLKADGALYHRIQRDRYGVEYLLAPADPRRVAIGRAGMTEDWRMQIELLGPCDAIPPEDWDGETPPIEDWGACEALPTTPWSTAA